MLKVRDWIWTQLYQRLKISKFKVRPLTEGEIKLCQSVFGDLIEYDQVRIMNHPFLPWQSVHVFMAPQGAIHARSFNYVEDYSQKSLGYQAVFIHEMAHIYQHQQNIHVLLHGAILQAAYFLSFKRYDPYRYTLTEGKNFFDYNIEQQGDIAKDIFLGKIKNIILNPY